MDISIKLIIACEAFKGELEHFKKDIQVDILWVKHSLHNVPKQLNLELKKKVKEAETMLQEGDTVLLFFGNCGGALDGISSEKLNLIYPEVDDCIPIMLGSLDKFRTLQKERPGTFYLNKAWIDSGQDPAGSCEEYQKTYGQEKGWKVATRMYKHYTHFALIDNGCYQLEPYKKRVLQSCTKFGKEFVEEDGDLSFVADILNNKCKMRKISAGK